MNATLVEQFTLQLWIFRPDEKELLSETLESYEDILEVNVKAVDAYGGPFMILDLTGPNCKPCIALNRHFTQEQKQMVRCVIKKLVGRYAI